MFRKKIEYYRWDDYKDKMDFLDDFNFRQQVRRDNMRVLGVFKV